MKQATINKAEDGHSPRKPYSAPEIKRVELALEETLTAGCKLIDTACTDPHPGVSEAGS
jgi:hypothetical protein